jgi:hypothetical protein
MSLIATFVAGACFIIAQLKCIYLSVYFYIIKCVALLTHLLWALLLAFYVMYAFIAIYCFLQNLFLVLFQFSLCQDLPCGLFPPGFLPKSVYF